MLIFFYNYSIISSLFKQFHLVIKHEKSETFHLSRVSKNFNPSPLNLKLLEDTILK